jgi:predicted GIY-YIG superfamily endonuclease
MSAYVYTLNLEKGRKYVGMTSNINRRLDQHFNGDGAKWTQKYLPVSVNSIQKVSSVDYAKKLETKIYHNMKDYHGTEKVRGAGHTTSIEKSSPKKTGACYRCGRTSHWSPDCYASTHIDGYSLDDSDSEYESD